MSTNLSEKTDKQISWDHNSMGAGHNFQSTLSAYLVTAYPVVLFPPLLGRPRILIGV